MTETAPTRRIIYPSLADPRWFQLAFLGAFVTYAETSPGFARDWMQWVVGTVTCVTLDLVVTRVVRRLWLVPMSGFISSMGLLLLCDSPWLWPYVACGALAILSKQAIRFQGRHIFNPLNFGIVMGLLFFSADMTVVAGRWGGGFYGMLLIAALGCVVVWRAKRLDVSLAYAVTFVAGAYLQSRVTGASFLVVAGPMTGAAFQLFTFFMISDPMTTPQTRTGRIVFAVLLGVIDRIIRYERIEHAPFFALFIMAGLLPIFRRYFVPPVEEQVWVPKTLALGSSPGSAASP